MSRSRVVPVLIALLAVSALGVTATSLETTLTTDPDEAIDPNWDRLPIGEGDAAVIKQEMNEGNGDETGASAADDADGATDGSGGDGEGAAAPLPDRDEMRESRGSDEDAGGIGFASERVPDPREPSRLDSLLSLFVAILRVLLPVVATLALAVLAYRYRGKLQSLLGPKSVDEVTSESALESEAWPRADPSNVVDRAWLTMVRRVDPERPETTTTAECRAIARDRPMDTEAVEAIATAFERVHYGGVPVADEADRAREGLRQLDGGTDD